MSNFGSQIQTAVHVRLATAAALPTCVYADASSVLPANTDLGAKLTASSAAALTIDGVAVVVDDEVLVKDQAATLQNGVYRVRVVGSTTVKWVLERSRLARDSGQFDGMIVTTGAEGSANPSIVFVYSGGATPVIGTDAITYSAQLSAAAAAATYAPAIGGPGLFVPLTGDICNFGTPQGDIGLNIVTPAGTLAALTFQLANGVYDGQVQVAVCTQIITALTLTGAFSSTSGLAQPTALVSGQTVAWVWSDSETDWIRWL